MSANQDDVSTVYAVIEKDPVQAAGFNMPDYEAARAAFKWEGIAQALDIPRGNGCNLATVCIDGHSPEVMQRTAMIWVGTDGREAHYTFARLREQTNQFANALTILGVKRGDRAFVFLERVPELYIAVFALLKIGAVVGPLFSAFGPGAIRDRLDDCQATTFITNDALKPRLDSVRAELPALQHVIVVRQDSLKNASPLQAGEVLYSDIMANASIEFDVPYTDPDDYSIIQYTSGTTGKPKGAVHRHASVMAQYATARTVLDIRPETDIYWCTADPGWVTGTSYGMFGPWAAGATILVYEGPFSAELWYKLIQDYKITVWYTAPTAIRMLMKAGEALASHFDFSSLRNLCSVGEPLNPEAVVWGQQVFGHVFHDTWWQTETGAIHITNYPCMPVKPGSMGKPFPGTEAGILDEAWKPLPVGTEGNLAIRVLAPSMFQAYWNRDELFQSRFRDGWYITGDRARIDADGYYWFIGRSDDVINTAGHLVGPFEVESALIEHPAVAEAGVIGKPDPERLEVVKAFISLKEGYEPSEALKKEIQTFVRTRLAAHAYPREIEFLASLPKTRSGKIMRRLLKSRELGLPEGDTSTLEE